MVPSRAKRDINALQKIADRMDREILSRDEGKLKGKKLRDFWKYRGALGKVQEAIKELEKIK